MNHPNKLILSYMKVYVKFWDGKLQIKLCPEWNTIPCLKYRMILHFRFHIAILNGTDGNPNSTSPLYFAPYGHGPQWLHVSEGSLCSL